MIKDIQEYFGAEGQWATLHQATVSLVDMGDRTISTQVKIDGDHVPDFSGWELSFKGERFILPIREPQAAKDNTSLNSLVDLTFYSWGTYQLKRYFFVSLTQIESGVEVADKYNASVILPVESFVQLFNRVLRYYFGDKIRMDLSQAGQGIYSTNPVAVEINHTYIWDVLTKFYEIFGLRWRMEYEQSTGTYVIKVNYAAEDISDHDFEYGYQGGLIRFERQVQDDNINNILLGRGGEKNLPYRYFKRVDPQNPNWAADPDAIPELANIYFDRLRDINFRRYVQGWRTNPNRDTSWEAVQPYDAARAVTDWAYAKGHTDATFSPVEYVKDDESIAKYGERWGALDDNDDIYPSIQGIEISGLGRVDEVVAVSDIATDDIDASVQAEAVETNLGGVKSKTINVPRNGGTAQDSFRGTEFTVGEDMTATLYGRISHVANRRIRHEGDPTGEEDTAMVNIDEWRLSVYDASSGALVKSSTNGIVAAIPTGRYYLEVSATITNNASVALDVTYSIDGLRLVSSSVAENAWKPTFDIWLKNLWETAPTAGENDTQYAERVWGPILGDRAGNEAKIVFSDGFMSVSEDYEFVIASYPVRDTSKELPSGVRSEWKLTLYKSDAEFQATGLFIPNATTGGKPAAGDHFYFTGIDMPHKYVVWGEEQVNAKKTEALENISDINPTWIIALDKVRVHTIEEADNNIALADRLQAGTLVTIKDKRFTHDARLSLYVQSITYTWNEPSDDSPYLVPDIEVVLSDKVVSSESPVARLNNDVSVIRSTYAKTSDIESVVRRVASPLFLKKTGESDSSDSPTAFGSTVKSKDFRQGGIGGSGWGHYIDGENDSVLEIDKLLVRKELQVNSLVANQIAYEGGRQIISAASIECTQVVDTGAGYECYFDQKQGSVANLFQVGDIAMGQMFDPENNEERYYRAVVTAVSDNSITLSKSQKDGEGIPEAGDTIVQYGSISDPTRQYVIIRDVIGGGYERMLSELQTPVSAGKEYYFAGRQNGSTPRWFVGDSAGEYAEYLNGQLNIKGRISVRKSDGTYQSMSDYITNIQNVTDNLQSQIDGAVQTWSADGEPTLQNYPASSWTDVATKNNHIGDLYYDLETGHGYRFMYTESDGFFWFQLTDEDVTTALAEAARANQGVAGLQYLKTALADGSTIVEGGLVLTNLIQLGKEESGVFNVYSGINGLMDPTARGNGIAAWYGGPMTDHEADASAANYAKSLFRFDGSGYLASGNIGWDASGAGHIPGISWEGNSVIISGDVKLASLSGDSVTELLSLVRNLNNWFGEDENGDVYVKRDGTRNRNFYAFGQVAAGGLATDSGGGSGADLSRVWESLVNNTDFPDVKINIAHIPTIPYSNISGTPTIIDRARNLLDGDDLCYVDPDEGEEIEIDDPGVTGTVLWGAESANQVALSVNGTSKLLLKAASLDGINSSISTLLGYFSGGSARNALALENHGASYFATASGLSALDERVAALEGGSFEPTEMWDLLGAATNEQINLSHIPDITTAKITDIETWIAGKGYITQAPVASVVGQTGAITTAQIAGALTSAGYKLTDTTYSVATQSANGLLSSTDKTKLDGIATGATRVTEETVSGWGFSKTSGTVSSVKVGDTPYNPVSGVVSLPAYPTSLPASDVYPWAKAESLAVASVPDLPWSKISSGKPTTLAGYGIGDAKIENGVITLGNDTITPLTQHQSLDAYVNAAGYNSTLKQIELKHGSTVVATVDATAFIKDGMVSNVTISGGYLVISFNTDSGKEDIRIPISDIFDASNYYTKSDADDLFLLKTNFTKANIGLGNVDNLAASAYFTLLENDNNQLSITVGGTNKKLTVDYASQAGNASTLENHAASYFATASALSAVSGRVTTLENRQNWDDIFGIDANGDVYVKLDGNRNRNFYAYGNVSAGGLNSEGGGSSIDLARVWESLTNNTDFPDEKINLAHIPTIPYSNISGTPTIIDSARNLLDGDDLCYVDPEEGEEITIDDPGTTGTVLWGAESANQVSLSVNGVSKLLLKAASIEGITSRLGILEGYFSGGVARNAAQLNGHSDSYFATTSALNALANQPATESTLGLIKIGAGLAINDGVVSVTGQTQGTVTRVDVGSTQYNPNTDGVVSLPAYPTTLPASDVSAWAKASSLAVDSVPSLPWSKITSGIPTTLAGYGITDAKFSSAGVSDKIRITLGSNYHDVLTAHQSLSGYATESWVGQQGFITKAVNDLTNYYLKSDTYTKTEVEDLIAAINQFHYEIAESTSDVLDPQSNVLYLIGPSGSGSDRYEEYVYTTTWVKIGDTSIDLSGYVNDISASGIGNYVTAISKNGNRLTVSYGTLPTTIALSNVTGADDLKAIEALTETSGLLRKTAENTWALDTSEYLTGIDSEMIENALGYTAFDEQDFTKNNIQRTLGISDWALAASKPGYSLSEISGTDDLQLIEALTGGGLLRRNANNTWSLDTNTYLTDYTIYALTIKNSAGENVLNYNPKTAAGEMSLTKAMVGLGNVENTALSTWQGSQNINTMGTVTTGVWHGSAIANEYLALDMSWALVRASATYDTEDYIHAN